MKTPMNFRTAESTRFALAPTLRARRRETALMARQLGLNAMTAADAAPAEGRPAEIRRGSPIRLQQRRG